MSSQPCRNVRPAKPHSQSGCATQFFLGVEILRIKLCSTCATIDAAEENYVHITDSNPICGVFSARSSFRISRDAQAKRIPAARCAPFPHFHSDGYYYGLYRSSKTGYSSPSQ
jgi:hypothetical protein